MIQSFIDHEIRVSEQEILDNAVKQHKKAIAAENAKYSIHITKHSGKLDGIPSINTSSLTNPYCIERSKNPKSICSKCYSNSLSKLRKNLEAKLIQNSKVLSSQIIPRDRLPIFNNLYVRFSSFGDLINMNHLINIVHIAQKNPKTIFAIWTKRTDLIKQFLPTNDQFDYYTTPNNLIIIYSNPIMNTNMTQVPKGFDKVFQVYTKEYAEETAIDINCGAKSCLSCLNCYEFNDEYIINELVK